MGCTSSQNISNEVVSTSTEQPTTVQIPGMTPLPRTPMNTVPVPLIRNLSFILEIPLAEQIPVVDVSIPNTYTVRQTEGSVVTTHILDDYCPIGSPGRLVLGLDITTEMMPVTSLHLSGEVMNISVHPQHEHNKLCMFIDESVNLYVAS